MNNKLVSISREILNLKKIFITIIRIKLLATHILEISY